MDETTKIQLIKGGRHELVTTFEINASGYAGVNQLGHIVDRRVYPDAVPVQENELFGVPVAKELPELALFDIWSEGFSITGNSSGAQKLNKGSIMAHSFDHAVKLYMDFNPAHGIEVVSPKRFGTPEGYLNRRSNYEIWACSLFADEAEARKSFG